MERLPTPVVVTGGLSSDAKALEAFEESGAAAVMLARGSFGNPWLFARLLGRYEGEPEPRGGAGELDWVIGRAEEHLGEERAGRYLRKFYPWYADTLGLTKRERQALVTAPTTEDARMALRSLERAPALADRAVGCRSATEIRQTLGWALVAALTVAALTAIGALVGGSFDDTDWRVLGTSLGFALFSATGACGSLSPAAARQRLFAADWGRHRCRHRSWALRARSFGALWIDDDAEGLWRGVRLRRNRC